MESKDDLQIALRSLRNVRRMARRLQRVPVDCLRVNSNDIAGRGICDGMAGHRPLPDMRAAGRIHAAL